MKPRRSGLTFDGNRIKARLFAEKKAEGPVHVDWLRFTARLRNCPTPSIDLLFPPASLKPETDSIWDPANRAQLLTRILRDIQDCDATPATVAYDLAERVASVLGPHFSVGAQLLKGQDFYSHRWPLMLEEKEVAWVGFGSSSDSVNQKAQRDTVHVNVHGMACTFAAPGWRHRMADLMDEYGADMTRIDLAVDAFEGLPRGMEGVKADYMAGAMDCRGKRPKCDVQGDWCNGAARSFYIGSREAGKQTNVYEKGHQLFGVDAPSLDPWVRAELRLGNKCRELPSDVLRNPAPYFAGASGWHEHFLAHVACQYTAPAPIKCREKLKDKTAQAAVTRVFRWLERTAAPAISFAFRECTDAQFLDLCSTTKLPGRLQGFAEATRRAAAASFTTSHACPA